MSSKSLWKVFFFIFVFLSHIFFIFLMNFYSPLEVPVYLLQRCLSKNVLFKFRIISSSNKSLMFIPIVKNEALFETITRYNCENLLRKWGNYTETDKYSSNFQNTLFQEVPISTGHKVRAINLFFWGFMKSWLCVNKSEATLKLESEILSVFCQIPLKNSVKKPWKIL